MTFHFRICALPDELSHDAFPPAICHRCITFRIENRMIDATTHIRRETRVSIVINAVLSVLFFLLVFGWNGPVRV